MRYRLSSENTDEKMFKIAPKHFVQQDPNLSFFSVHYFSQSGYRIHPDGEDNNE